MVSVAVAGEEPVRVRDEGEIAQTRLRSENPHDRLTTPVKAPRGVTVSVEVADCPGADTFKLVGLADRL
jgi:hypothetical protein